MSDNHGTMQIPIQELLELGWQSDLSEGTLHFQEITDDSRKTNSDCIFFAFDGASFRGIDFLTQVAENKTPAVFADSRYRDELLTFIKKQENMAQGRPALFWGAPYRPLAIETMKKLFGGEKGKPRAIGVTGTNGKSTIAYGLYKAISQIENDENPKAASVGTLGVFIGDEARPGGLTTPSLTEIQYTLGLCRARSVEYCSLEASSHGLDQGRLDGVDWSYAIFTNLTPDHRDYHPEMESYFLSKRKLFEQILNRFRREPESVAGGLVNTEDPYGQRLYQWIKEEEPEFSLTGLGPAHDSTLDQMSFSLQGSQARFRHNGHTYDLKIPSIGKFNLWNHAAILAALLALGFSEESALGALRRLPPAPGRMEVFESNGRYAIVDYAHTPDALENVLHAVRELAPKKLHLVFGCGGDRDSQKRPAMGKIAEQNADSVILTNDNPRSEKPEAIIQAIGAGMSCQPDAIIYDRSEAIRAALEKLEPGEAAVIAGKGHEDYQILREGKIHFDDREEVRKVFGLQPRSSLQ